MKYIFFFFIFKILFYYFKESKYDLVGVICHHGTAGGGHYTAYALNNMDQEWYEYDDSYVTKVEPATVMNAEAYVLFYRKNNFNMEPLREELQTFLDQEAGLVKFYISRQWLNKFENFAEPGKYYSLTVSYTHLTLPTTPYV